MNGLVIMTEDCGYLAVSHDDHGEIDGGFRFNRHCKKGNILSAAAARKAWTKEKEEVLDFNPEKLAGHWIAVQIDKLLSTQEQKFDKKINDYEALVDLMTV